MAAPRVHRRAARQAGLTLVELVKVVAVGGVVALVPARVLHDSMRVYARTAPRLEAAYQVGLASERLRRDLRALGDRSALSTLTSTAITFDDTGGTTIAYALSGSELQRDGDALATGVTAFSLVARDATGTATTTAEEIVLFESDLTVTLGGQSVRRRTVITPRSVVAAAPAGPIDATASAATAYEHDDDHFHMDLVSISSSDVVVSSFELSADVSMPDLKEFKLDGKKIWKEGSGIDVPTGETACNQGSTSDRTIDALDDPEARIKFKSDPSSGSSTLTLVLNFTDGSSSTVVFDVDW